MTLHAMCRAVMSCIVLANSPLFAVERLQIVVLEGQGAINNIKAGTGRDPIVEIRDENGKPVLAATVTFQTPSTGPGALFGSSHMIIAHTDSSGRAAGRGLHPNGVAGPFDIRVTASYEAYMASEVIRQVNAGPNVSSGSRKLLWISLLAGGAAAGGILAASHGSSSTPATPAAASPPVTGTVLIPTGTTFGAPPR